MIYLLWIACFSDDMLRAIKKLRILGNGFTVLNVGNMQLVQSVPGELTMDHTNVLQTAQVRSLFLSYSFPLQFYGVIFYVCGHFSTSSFYHFLEGLCTYFSNHVQSVFEGAHFFGRFLRVSCVLSSIITAKQCHICSGLFPLKLCYKKCDVKVNVCCLDLIWLVVAGSWCNIP